MPAKWQQWMPFKIDAFRASAAVAAMHPAARIGFVYLLTAQWQSEDSTISADPLDLAEESGIGDELWALHGPRILRKFAPVDGQPGRLRNDVCYEEWLEAKRIFEEGQAHREEVSRKRAEAGRIGNAKRWGSQTEGFATNQPSQPNPNEIANDRLTGTGTGTGTGTEIQRELTLLSPAAPTPVEPPTRPEDFANTWNKRRGDLPRVDKFTDSRRNKLKTRLKEGLTLDKFIEAIENCRAKPFLSGDNDSGWTATFDWLIENSTNLEKAINNPYGLNRTPTGGTNGKPASSDDKLKSIADAAVAQFGRNSVVSR
jgi:hypothetical protein